jgi:type II secretion system protein D
MLDDVRILPYQQSDALIVTAPPASMDLILALIRALDVPPAATSEVKVFPLKRADAFAMAQLLQQLFLGAALPQQGGLRGGLGLGTLPGQLGQTQFTLQRSTLTVGPTTGEGAPLVELRIAVDQRTNSIIVAGSRSDLLLAEAIILRLDESDIRERRNEVYKLRNTTAVDIANALQLFLRSEAQLLGLSGELTPFTQIEREVVVVPEILSNSLIISATPRFYEEVIRIIAQLDEEPPQVVIQVLLAEIRLDGTEEFGVEWGFQSPVMFDRGIIPAEGFFNGGTINYTAPATGVGLVPPGVTVNSSVNPAAVPGFNFNNTGPLPNNPVVSPSSLATQGITNLGLGRASANSGIGGFVFSAASDTVNVLIRALKTQGKIEVLSRPQIMTLDNQTALIQVGQTVPYITGTQINVTGGITNIIQPRDVGIILQVTPKISPDGHVVMRVEPQVSSLSTSTVNLGNNVFAPIINIIQASTTVSAMDGETVVIGGLITRRDDKQERKIPWFGDLPCVGAAFRFRSQIKAKSELLIIMTPHVVRNSAEAQLILSEESQKMDWCLKDVINIHGPRGVDGLIGPGHQVDGGLCEPLPGSGGLPGALPEFRPGPVEEPIHPPRELEPGRPAAPLPGKAPAGNPMSRRNSRPSDEPAPPPGTAPIVVPTNYPNSRPSDEPLRPAVMGRTNPNAPSPPPGILNPLAPPATFLPHEGTAGQGMSSLESVFPSPPMLTQPHPAPLNHDPEIRTLEPPPL